MYRVASKKIILVGPIVFSLVMVFIFNMDVLAVGALDYELGPKTALKLSIPIYLFGFLSFFTAMFLIIRKEINKIGDGNNEKI